MDLSGVYLSIQAGGLGRSTSLFTHHHEEDILRDCFRCCRSEPRHRTSDFAGIRKVDP